MNPELREALANEYAKAADDLEQMADDRDNLNIPESFKEAHAAVKQMRIDARWIRARAVKLRMEGLDNG
jgi:hypothetical protein